MDDLLIFYTDLYSHVDSSLRDTLRDWLLTTSSISRASSVRLLGPQLLVYKVRVILLNLPLKTNYVLVSGTFYSTHKLNSRKPTDWATSGVISTSTDFVTTLASALPCVRTNWILWSSKIPLAYLSIFAHIIIQANQLAPDHQSFIFKPPHTTVSSQTLARWASDQLSDSGVDTEIFKAHSTRAVTSNLHAQVSPASRFANYQTGVEHYQCSGVSSTKFY